jgi:hypothetical protein
MLTYLEQSEKSQLAELIQEYSDLFSSSTGELGCTTA